MLIVTKSVGICNNESIIKCWLFRWKKEKLTEDRYIEGLSGTAQCISSDAGVPVCQGTVEREDQKSNKMKCHDTKHEWDDEYKVFTSWTMEPEVGQS